MVGEKTVNPASVASDPGQIISDGQFDWRVPVETSKRGTLLRLTFSTRKQIGAAIGRLSWFCTAGTTGPPRTAVARGGGGRYN